MISAEIFLIINLLCGLTSLIIAIFKALRIYKVETPDRIGLFGIWFFGLLAFLFGILGQTIQMIIAFDVMAQMGNVSALIIADELSNSSRQTIVGLLILITSVILWGIVKSLKNSQIRKKGD